MKHALNGLVFGLVLAWTATASAAADATYSAGGICHPARGGNPVTTGAMPPDYQMLSYNQFGIFSIATAPSHIARTECFTPYLAGINRVKVVGYNRNSSLSMFCNLQILDPLSGQALTAIKTLTLSGSLNSGPQQPSELFGGVSGILNVQCGIPPVASGQNSIVTSIVVSPL